jgi:hypothetical protein
MACEGVNWSQLAQDRVQWPGSCEHDNEVVGSIKFDEIINHLGDYQILGKNSAP